MGHLVDEKRPFSPALKSWHRSSPQLFFIRWRSNLEQFINVDSLVEADMPKGNPVLGQTILADHDELGRYVLVYEIKLAI